jgi:hypothetical protein
VLVILVLLSFQAVTILAICYAFPALTTNPVRVATLGVVFLGLVGYASHRGFNACGYRLSLVAVFFSITCWSAVVDLFLALSLLGATNLGRFYTEMGEEYFKSSWGFWTLLWDGTAHYAVQLYIAHATLLGRPCKLPSLLWCGSIINSMPVLLLGGATGLYSAEIKLSSALNAPYVLCPIFYLLSLLGTTNSAGKKRADASRQQPFASAERVAWAAAHAAMLIVHAWRAVIVLGSKSEAAGWWTVAVDPVLADVSRPSHGFLRVQCLVFFFYYMPFHAWACHQLLLAPPSALSSSGALAAWSAVVAGGYAQAQFTFIGSAAFKWVGFAPLMPASMTSAGGILSVALAMLPFAFAARCHWPDFAGKYGGMSSPSKWPSM